jgi:hypothetical protein
MHDDELREGLDRLLRPAREAAPPGLTTIRRRLRKRRIRLAATGGGVAVAAGVVALVVGLHGGLPRTTAAATGPGGTHQVAYSYTVSGPVHGLNIAAGVSSVTVTGGAAGTPVTVTDQISYARAEPALHSSVQAGTLYLGYSCPAGQACGVSYDVQVPSGVDVTVSLQTGSIDLTGLSGSVTASTGTGTINTQVASSFVSLSVQTGQVAANFTRPPTSLSVNDGTGEIVIGVPKTASYDLDYDMNVAISHISIRRDTGSLHAINVTSNQATSLYIAGL